MRLEDSLSFSLPHPVPLSLLVEQNDDQLGMHLVSVLAERQITSLKRDIHQVPAEGNIGVRVREREPLRCTSLPEKCLSGKSQRFYCFIFHNHLFANDSISQTLKFHCQFVFPEVFILFDKVAAIAQIYHLQGIRRSFIKR